MPRKRMSAFEKGLTTIGQMKKSAKRVVKPKIKKKPLWFTKAGMNKSFEKATGLKAKDVKSGRTKISR